MINLLQNKCDSIDLTQMKKIKLTSDIRKSGSSFIRRSVDIVVLNYRDGWRRQRSLSQRGSTTNVEANVTATTATADQVPATSQSKTRQRPIGQGSRSSGHSGSR